MAKAFQKLESRLNTIESRVTNNAKTTDDILTYSYQYNIKIIGVPQATDSETAEETANICPRIFAVIGIEITIADIDIAHGVQSEKFHSRPATQAHNL